MTLSNHVSDLAGRREAFSRQWGHSYERKEFDNPGAIIEVLRWDKHSNPTGSTLYVTVGMPQIRHTDHVEELMLWLDPDVTGAWWLPAAAASLRGEGGWRVSMDRR